MPLITCPSCLAKFESSGKAGTSCPTCGVRLDGRSRSRPADDEDDRPSRRRSRRDDDDEDDYDDRPRRRGRTRPLVDNRSAETIKSGLVLWGVIGLVTLLVFGGLVVFVAVFIAGQSEKMAERSRQQHAAAAAAADAGPWNPNGGDPNMPGVDPAQLQIPGAQQPPGGFAPPGMPQPPGFPPQQGGQQPMFPPGMQPPGFGPAGGGSGNGPPGGLQPPGFPQQPGAQPGFQPPGMPQPPGFQPPGMQPPGGFRPPGMPQPPGALGVPKPGGKPMPQSPAIPSAPGMPQGPGLPQPPGMQPGFGAAVATVELKNLRRVRGLGAPNDELEVEFEYTAGAVNPIFDKVVVKTANGTGDVNLAGFPQSKGKVRIKAFGRAKLTGKVEVWVERRNGVGPRATGQTISNTLTIE